MRTENPQFGASTLGGIARMHLSAITLKARQGDSGYVRRCLIPACHNIRIHLLFFAERTLVVVSYRRGTTPGNDWPFGGMPRFWKQL